MKSNLEKRLNAELEAMGVQIRTYHHREYLWPFVGVTIVTADSECTFLEVNAIVQNAVNDSVAYDMNRATLLKSELNKRGIYGIAICDRRDQYSKKRGRVIAKGRLLKHLKGGRK